MANIIVRKFILKFYYRGTDNISRVSTMIPEILTDFSGSRRVRVLLCERERIIIFLDLVAILCAWAHNL